jgi:hypothetical protein
MVTFAVCHCRAGSVAGTGLCYVKFAAVRPGPAAAEDFRRLLAACESLAVARQAGMLLGGMNMGRQQAYQALLAHGFRFGPLVGVTMHRPDEPGYDRPEVYVIDDWR